MIPFSRCPVQAWKDQDQDQAKSTKQDANGKEGICAAVTNACGLKEEEEGVKRNEAEGARWWCVRVRYDKTRAAPKKRKKKKKTALLSPSAHRLARDELILLNWVMAGRVVGLASHPSTGVCKSTSSDSPHQTLVQALCSAPTARMAPRTKHQTTGARPFADVSVHRHRKSRVYIAATLCCHQAPSILPPLLFLPARSPSHPALPPFFHDTHAPVHLWTGERGRKSGKGGHEPLHGKRREGQYVHAS